MIKSTVEIAEMEELADVAIDRAKQLLLDPDRTPDGVALGPPRALVWAIIGLDRRVAMVAAFAARGD